MSTYEPKPSDLKPVKLASGLWDIYDNHGPYDGPYASEAECWAVIREIIARYLSA